MSEQETERDYLLGEIHQIEHENKALTKEIKNLRKELEDAKK